MPVQDFMSCWSFDLIPIALFAIDSDDLRIPAAPEKTYVQV
jgi:hypothetical protein